ncbi:MAG: hypothetical protein MRY74_04460 [Neomegalonema sp.]|nr:hypothetical protein [Neomegalonema sp.]
MIKIAQRHLTAPNAAAPARRRRAPRLAAFALSLGTAAAAQEAPLAPPKPAPAGCGSVIVARFDWPEAELAASMIARLLTDGYQCKVTLAPASPRPTLRRLLAATEAPTLLIAPGLPADNARGGKIAAGGLLFRGAEQRGFVVAEWFAATRPQLKTLADVAARPDLFGRSGARPALHLCPVEWPCYAEGRAVARAHGLDRTFDLRPARSGAALAASLIRAHQDRKPWIGYYWSPSALSSQYPLRFLASAPQACAADGAKETGCVGVFAKRPLAVLFDARLAERAPAAAAMLRAFSLPPETVAETLRWRQENGASAQDAVDRFLETAPSIWVAWMRTDASRKVAAALDKRRGRARRVD